MPGALYRRDSLASPFDLGPVPGSAWDESHLKWLGVDIEDEHQVADMIPEEWVLQRSSKIHETLTQYLDLPWAELGSEHSEREQSAFYDLLELLGKKRAFAESPLDESSSPLGQASTPAVQMKRSPSIAESAPGHKTKRPRISSCSAPRSSISEQGRPGLTPPRPVSPQLREELSSDELHQPLEALRSKGHHHATVRENTTVDTSLPSSPPLHESCAPSSPPALPAHPLSSPNLPSLEGSDPSYRPTSSPKAEPDDLDLLGSSQEDKAEHAVQNTALAFLNTLQRAIRGAEKTLEFHVSSGLQLAVSIDGLLSRSTPDVNMAWKYKTRSDQLSVECKRKLHNLTHDQILGQEVCHLLCKAQADKNKRQKGHYITYLLSWHHLRAYISRLDVSDAYLNSLAFDSKRLVGRLSVKRSRLFNLKEPPERIEFACHTVEIILFLLGRFRSCYDAATRLRSFEGD